MDIHKKASLAQKYLAIQKITSLQLILFEEFCKVKTKFHDGSPGKYFYGDSLRFLKSTPGEWVEFQFLDKKFRIEASYLSDYSCGLLSTYEIISGTNDRSKKKYQFIDELNLIVDTTGVLTSFNLKQTTETLNQNREKVQIPLTSSIIKGITEDYIDFLWATVFKPAFS